MTLSLIGKIIDKTIAQLRKVGNRVTMNIFLISSDLKKAT